MVLRFSERLALLDERASDFLMALINLGGYCTSEQAKRLGLASSPTRVLAHMKGLERAGFLRRVANYPAVYQVTKSATRLMATDPMARRPHPVETVRTRLLAVNFYLEAIQWPAEFVLDHDQKIESFRGYGCPPDLLPKRAGKPYLWEEFVLKLRDNCLAVAVIDRSHGSAFRHVWGLVKRFHGCLRQLGDRMRLLVVVGSGTRHALYRRVGRHPRLQKLADGGFQVSVTTYQVRVPVPFVRSLTHPDGLCSGESHN